MACHSQNTSLITPDSVESVAKPDFKLNNLDFSPSKWNKII